MSHAPRDDDPKDHDQDDQDHDSNLSDDAIAKALEGFERELKDADNNGDVAHDESDGTDLNADLGSASGSDPDDAGDSDEGDFGLDDPYGSGDHHSRDSGLIGHPAQAPAGDFDEELEGLLGNKAKAAVIITRLTSAELLAAFCQVTDIAAVCVAGDQGAVAVLQNLQADAPERAARGLTTVVSGLAVVLAVNRADKLEATMYTHGEAGQTFVPPVLFASTASFVEDFMLGISTLDQLRVSGLHMVDSADYDHRQAMRVIEEHTQSGRGAADDE